jgi:hypothetical protein
MEIGYVGSVGGAIATKKVFVGSVATLKIMLLGPTEKIRNYAILK